MLMMTVPMMDREITDTVIMTGTLMSGADSSEFGGVSVGVVEGGVGIAVMPVGVQCEPPPAICTGVLFPILLLP